MLSVLSLMSIFTTSLLSVFAYMFSRFTLLNKLPFSLYSILVSMLSVLALMSVYPISLRRIFACMLSVLALVSILPISLLSVKYIYWHQCVHCQLVCTLYLNICLVYLAFINEYIPSQLVSCF